MKQLAFFIDVNRCISCYSCTYACNNENGPKFVKRRKVLTIEQEENSGPIHFSQSCNHCETPACMTVCKRNCIKKLRNGIVILDKQNCNGCGQCVSVCPFQAIKIDIETNKADKCDMCYKRLQRGKQPVCVEACIADAIKIGNLYENNDPDYKPTFKEYVMKTVTNPTTHYKYKRGEKIRIWSNEGEDNYAPINI